MVINIVLFVAAITSTFFYSDKLSLAYYVIVSMRLHHSPDASTFPRFKLMSFAYIICFSERIKRTRFLLGCMQPSSVMFTYYDFLTQLKIIGSGTIVW